MPIKEIPQNAQAIHKYEKTLSEYYGVNISIIQDPDKYILIKELLEIAIKMGKWWAVAELNKLLMDLGLKDITRADFKTTGEQDLKKMTNIIRSTFDMAQRYGEGLNVNG